MRKTQHLARWVTAVSAAAFLLLTGCASGDDSPNPDEDTATADTSSPDDTGATDTTPPDPPTDDGPWTIGDCADNTTGTGKKVGDIAFDFVQPDQHGNPLRLHDFCDRVVLIKGAAYW